MSDTATVLKQLHHLLDEERLCVMDGGMEHFPRFAERKAELMEALLMGHAPSEKELAQLREKADRNQRLLSAAVRAVRSVSGRLKAMHGNRQPLNTYGSDGRSRALGAGRASFERRA